MTSQLKALKYKRNSHQNNHQENPPERPRTKPTDALEAL